MGWFLYDNGLRHDRVKPSINNLSTFKEQRVGKYLNNGFFVKQIRRLSNIILKKDTQHIQFGNIIQRSTGTKLRWSDL